ncbi:mycothiol transferase [Micromonospora sp. NPDC003776]
MEATSRASEHGYPEPPAIGDEASTLLGSLERQRATFEWKCSGLDREQLTRRLDTSELTLGRLLKHLAYMEDINFTRDLAGAELPRPWLDVDATARSSWVFVSADADPPETLYQLWYDAVDRSRSAVRYALDHGGPQARYRFGASQEASVRRLLVDMIEEYARHTGHADILREAIDGRVGEDPPGPAVSFSASAEEP